GILSVVACLRYEQAILLPSDERDALSVLGLALAASSVVAGLVSIGVWAAPDQLYRLTNAKEASPLFWLLPFGVVAAGGYQALSSWAIRSKAFGNLARTRVWQSIGLILVQAVGGVVASGASGLIYGQVLGQSIGIVALGKHVVKRAS